MLYKTPYLRGSPFSWLELSFKSLSLRGKHLLINSPQLLSPSGGMRSVLTIDDTLRYVTTSFWGVGPTSVYWCSFVCWAVTYTGAHWLLGEMNSVYRKSRPQRNGPTFSASRLPMQTDPHEEWVMRGAGRSHGHRRCLCALSWPCRKRVNRLDGKA